MLASLVMSFRALGAWISESHISVCLSYYILATAYTPSYYMAPSHKDCKDKTGNYQNHEFDWLHWILQIIANH